MAVCNVPFCMGQPVLGLEHLLRTLHPDCASVDGTLVVGREIFHWPELLQSLQKRTSQYYFVLQSLQERTSQYYSVLQSLRKRTPQYYFVLQIACRNVLSSTTLYYKACRNALLCTTTLAGNGNTGSPNTAPATKNDNLKHPGISMRWPVPMRFTIC